MLLSIQFFYSYIKSYEQFEVFYIFIILLKTNTYFMFHTDICMFRYCLKYLI